jgi:hypothetical protein
LHVDPDKEKWCFDTFDSEALQEQIDTQMKRHLLQHNQGTA